MNQNTTTEALNPGNLASASSWASNGPLAWFLRFPLYNKIVVANSLFVGLAALSATVLSLRTVGASGTVLTLGVVGGSVLLAVVVTALANAFLVRVALSALDPLEDTVRLVEGGDLSARCSPSPLADADLIRLTTVFNEMLQRIEDARKRQRKLAVVVLEAEERERMWLARELYDETAQTLATTLLHLRTAVQHPGPQGDQALADVRGEIVEALDGIRRVARRLRPPELDELGLSAAVAAHARSLTEVSEVPIECETEAVDDRLSRESRLALYRILQEALNNAVRHAEAHQVRVSIGQEGAKVHAVVRDDGKGFDPTAAPESHYGTFGLVGIHERAAYLGGSATVDSTPGQGTAIRIEIPASNGVGDPEVAVEQIPD